jgi:hypothetical protein
MEPSAGLENALKKESEALVFPLFRKQQKRERMGHLRLSRGAGGAPGARLRQRGILFVFELVRHDCAALRSLRSRRTKR